LNLTLTTLFKFFKTREKRNLFTGSLLFTGAIISLVPGTINLAYGLQSLSWTIFNFNNVISIFIFSFLMMLPSLVLFSTSYLLWEGHSLGWKLSTATCGVALLVAATSLAALYFAVAIAALSGLAAIFVILSRKNGKETKDSPIVTENMVKLGLRFSVALCASIVIAMICFLLVIASPFLSLQLFTKYTINTEVFQEMCWGVPEATGAVGGVLGFAIGSLLVVCFCEFIAVPIGIAAAIYLAEYASQNRIVSVIRFFIETLAGSPSIVMALMGIVIFSVILHWGTCLWAAAVALSFMALPWNIRVAEGALRSVPQSYREASFALGATQWQTARLVTLYAAIPGIITGILLGIGVAIGETLVLLFNCTSQALITVLPNPWWKIFNFRTQIPTLTPLIYSISKAPIGNLSQDPSASLTYFQTYGTRLIPYSLAAAVAVVLITIYLFICIVALLVRNRLIKRMMGT